MHAAKINGQVYFGFRHIYMQSKKITEEFFDPHRYVQFTATASLHTGRIAVLAIMNNRQAPTGPYPVLKIQCPYNPSDINPMGTARITYRFMT